MFCLNDTMRYYLCPGRTDMRKGISSLCGVVFFFNDTATTEIYTATLVGSVRCV